MPILFHQQRLKFGSKSTVNGLRAIKQHYLFLASLLCFNSSAEITINSDFKYLNQLRQTAGLTSFSWNNQLAKSAQNHAGYLTKNNQHGHYEQQGKALFTGEWVTERAIAEKYPNRMASENVTSKSGDNLFYNPIDSLMSAIYHRFGFLNLSNNEIGIGHQDGQINSYVYVMGNSNISDLCQQPEFTANGEYNFKICANSRQRLDKRLVDNSKFHSQQENANIIIWPAQNSRDISPVFYQESPDPLPHHSVSGYPVSIQFNPSFFTKAPKVNSFKLVKTSSKLNITTITLLNKDNDPNKLLNSFQHALFPTQRLEWNTNYTATVEYLNHDTQSVVNIKWSFQTKKFNPSIITVKESSALIKVKKGQRYILYFPPRNAQDINAALQYRDYQMNLKLNYIDNNTLNAFITDNGKAELTFHNKTITLQTD